VQSSLHAGSETELSWHAEHLV